MSNSVTSAEPDWKAIAERALTTIIKSANTLSEAQAYLQVMGLAGAGAEDGDFIALCRLSSRTRSIVAEVEVVLEDEAIQLRAAGDGA